MGWPAERRDLPTLTGHPGNCCVGAMFRSLRALLDVSGTNHMTKHVCS